MEHLRAAGEIANLPCNNSMATSKILPGVGGNRFSSLRSTGEEHLLSGEGLRVLSL